MEALRDITDDQWRNDLKFPIGLINKIKKLLSETDVEMTEQPAAEQINTVPAQAQSTFDTCFALLNQLQTQCDMGSLRNSVTTLFKVITNIQNNPMEPKFRKLSKTSKALNEKILQFQAARQFIMAAGFREEPDAYTLSGFNTEQLEEASKAINSFLQTLGASVDSNSSFNPYQAGISSTTGMRPVQVMAQEAAGEKTKLQ